MDTMWLILYGMPREMIWEPSGWNDDVTSSKVAKENLKLRFLGIFEIHQTHHDHFDWTSDLPCFS